MPTKSYKELAEIINLEAINELPKATEHFISDIHGEFEAFDHLRRNCSGIIRIKATELFDRLMTAKEIDEFCFTIYYPEEFIQGIDRSHEQWQVLLTRLVELTRHVSSKYTRSKVRKALDPHYAYILEELLYQYDQERNKTHYYQTIFNKIIELELAPYFSTMLCQLIQRFVVDHLHVLGDIFDRGAQPDKVMEALMTLPSVDITLGNHDIIWMGAYCGNLACLATVLRIAFRYGHTRFLEEGYGIDLSRLKKFALKHYKDNPAFHPKTEQPLSPQTHLAITAMHQAMTIMQFKLEGQLILRRPEYMMDHRLQLLAIDFSKETIKIEGQTYSLSHTCFDLVDPQNPHELDLSEELVLLDLLHQLQTSQKFAEHMHFLKDKGKMFIKYNGNLLFHGCIPINPQGDYSPLIFNDQVYQGEALLRLFDDKIQASYENIQSLQDEPTDFLWYLWCGPLSPLFGKDTMRTFERYFIEDTSIHKEIKNPYYALRDDENFCRKILKDFGLSESGYIINGHTPVQTIKGENPIRANGKMLVIDGGLSKAYQKVTGIAGYTLVDNSHEVYLVAHHPFASKQQAMDHYLDIHPTKLVVLTRKHRQKVRATDIGKELIDQANQLKEHLRCEL